MDAADETLLFLSVLTLQRVGRSVPVIDGLLAATAIQYNLTLVSRNARDFVGIPVQTLNPWVA